MTSTLSACRIDIVRALGKVYREMTTRYVLVTEWVDGVKASNMEATTPEGKACLAKLQVR